MNGCPVAIVRLVFAIDTPVPNSAAEKLFAAGDVLPTPLDRD